MSSRSALPAPFPQTYNPGLPPPLPGQLSHNPSQSSLASTSASSWSLRSDGSLRSVRVDYTQLPYFFSNFSNPNEVADYLKFHSKGTPGHFLLRPSFRNPKTQLTISVVVKDKTVRHTNILIENLGNCTKYFLVKEKKFDSVVELVDYYKHHEVKNLQNVKNVRFLYPIEAGLRTGRDNGSTSSGGSYNSPYSLPGSNAGTMEPAPPIPLDRPPLPARPKDLPRRNSSHSGSLGSPGSVCTPSPSASGPNFQEDFSSGLDGPGAMGLPFGCREIHAAGSQTSLGSNSASLMSSPSMSSIDVDSRPPAPIPASHNASEKSLYYSTPRNVNEDISEKLKEVLKQSERCDCGIPKDMSDLPLGWTVHRSKDEGSKGRIFYQSSKGLTTWKLPEEVQRKLTATHKANLNKLFHMVQRNMFNSSYLENPRQTPIGDRSGSRPNSGSGGNLDPRQMSGSSGGRMDPRQMSGFPESGGQTSGRANHQVRITHLTEF